MVTEQQRSSTWIGKTVLVAITVLAAQLHSTGSPERADAAGAGMTTVGVVLGTAIAAIVVARLFGKSLPLIASDRAAMVAVLVVVAAKIVIARVFLPV